jgi:hypothetical protein
MQCHDVRTRQHVGERRRSGHGGIGRQHRRAQCLPHLARASPDHALAEDADGQRREQRNGPRFDFGAHPAPARRGSRRQRQPSQQRRRHRQGRVDDRVSPRARATRDADPTLPSRRQIDVVVARRRRDDELQVLQPIERLRADLHLAVDDHDLRLGVRRGVRSDVRNDQVERGESIAQRIGLGGGNVIGWTPQRDVHGGDRTEATRRCQAAQRASKPLAARRVKSDSRFARASRSAESMGILRRRCPPPDPSRTRRTLVDGDRRVRRPGVRRLATARGALRRERLRAGGVRDRVEARDAARAPRAVRLLGVGDARRALPVFRLGHLLVPPRQPAVVRAARPRLGVRDRASVRTARRSAVRARSVHREPRRNIGAGARRLDDRPAVVRAGADVLDASGWSAAVRRDAAARVVGRDPRHGRRLVALARDHSVLPADVVQSAAARGLVLLHARFAGAGHRSAVVDAHACRRSNEVAT